MYLLALRDSLFGFPSYLSDSCSLSAAVAEDAAMDAGAHVADAVSCGVKVVARSQHLEDFGC